MKIITGCHSFHQYISATPVKVSNKFDFEIFGVCFDYNDLSVHLPNPSILDSLNCISCLSCPCSNLTILGDRLSKKKLRHVFLKQEFILDSDCWLKR